MRNWKLTLADGRTVTENARHGAVSHWDGQTCTQVKFRSLTSEAYGDACPLAVCWCQSDTWTPAPVLTLEDRVRVATARFADASRMYLANPGPSTRTILREMQHALRRVGRERVTAHELLRREYAGVAHSA